MSLNTWILGTPVPTCNNSGEYEYLTLEDIIVEIRLLLPTSISTPEYALAVNVRSYLHAIGSQGTVVHSYIRPVL